MSRKLWRAAGSAIRGMSGRVSHGRQTTEKQGHANRAGSELPRGRTCRAAGGGLLLAAALAVLLVIAGGCGFVAGWLPRTLLPGPAGPATAAPTLAAGPTLTPAPVPTHLPTPLANARVTGHVCQAGATIFLRSCCPPYEARETSDAAGSFAFEGLTEGTFTVTFGLYSEVVTLETYESQVDVDLCPPPTHPPLAR